MKKILILYDYPTVRELLAEDLAAAGHLVVPIDKLDLAKELIGTLGPDLVLLNVHINGKERWDVLEDIKKDYPTLPVLVLRTCSTDHQDRHDNLTHVYDLKNYHFEGLRRKIAKIFQQERDRTTNTLDFPHSAVATLQHGMR